MFDIAFWTLYIKEIRRFFRVYHQTLLAPIVNAVIFYVIFTLSIGKVMPVSNFKAIIVSGLIIMTVLQNSYANTSSSISMCKILGHIIDYLITPFKKQQVLLATTLAGVTRGFVVGIVLYFVFMPLAGWYMHNLILMVVAVFLGSAIFAVLGVIFGSMSASFDETHAYQSYIIAPLTFLSGTFYLSQTLPISMQYLVKCNPVFHMINLFRYGMIGVSEFNIWISMAVLCVCLVITYIFAVLVMNKYYTVR